MYDYKLIYMCGGWVWFEHVQCTFKHAQLYISMSHIQPHTHIVAYVLFAAAKVRGRHPRRLHERPLAKWHGAKAVRRE